MKLVSNAFRPWIDGSGRDETILIGDPNGKPYVVRASGNSWLPINVLVFASSKEDAVERVKLGLRKSLEIAEKRHKDETENKSYPYAPDDSSVIRFKTLIDLMEKKSSVSAEPYDPRYICKINWDGRGL